MPNIRRAALVCLVAFCLLATNARACTTFCFDGPDGPVFGANLDLFIPGDGFVFINQRGIAKTGLGTSTTGETAEWTSEYGSVTFNLAGREFAFGGMNEAGLVVGSMELLAGEFPAADERPPLAIGMWAQYVLDTCATIEEVLEVNSKVRLEDSAPPNHFFFADADGNCLAIEWIDGEYIHRTGDTLPIKAMANMEYERALAAYERGGPGWFWSNPGQSAERVAACHDRNNAFDPTGDISPIDYAFETLIKHVVAGHTKWSIVYDIGKREIWYGSAVSQTGKHIVFDKLDFSCEAPLLMLDVNAQLEGDVEEHFTPYDPGKNRQLFQTICDRFELNIAPEVTDDVMSKLNSFVCE